MFAFRNCRTDSSFTVRSSFVSLHFGEEDTQRRDIGQIASSENSDNRWKRGDLCAVFDSVSKIGMVLLFDISAGKSVIFLAIFTRENCQDLTYRKVIILFPFIPKEGNLTLVCYSFYWQTNKDALCIADKCIKEEFHWQNNPNCTPRYEAENL